MNNWLVVLITINFCIAVYCNIVFILYEINMRRVRSEYQIEKVMSKPKTAFNTFLYVILNFIPFYNVINAISFTASVMMSLYKPSESDARIVKFYEEMKNKEKECRGFAPEPVEGEEV